MGMLAFSFHGDADTKRQGSRLCAVQGSGVVERGENKKCFLETNSCCFFSKSALSLCIRLGVRVE